MKRNTSAAAKRRNLLIVGGVIVVVLVVAVIAIALSGNQSGNVNVDNIPQSRGEDGSFILGNPDAPITIVEFADFACPHCQAYQSDIVNFQRDYVATGKAQFEYRVFPTAGGALSLYTGQLIECAEEQKAGSFWRSYELMFEYAFSGRYNQEVGRLLATDEGLNYNQLLTCAETANQVNVDGNFGQNAGVSGTPAVLVRYGDGPADFVNYNGRTYSSGGPPYSVLAALVDAVQ